MHQGGHRGGGIHHGGMHRGMHHGGIHHGGIHYGSIHHVHRGGIHHDGIHRGRVTYVGNVGNRHHYGGGRGMTLSASGAKYKSCGIGLIVFSVVIISSGAVLTGIGYSRTWSDPFFGTRTMKVLGLLFLIAGIIMICVGSALMVVYRSKSGYGLMQVAQPNQTVVAEFCVTQPTLVGPPAATGTPHTTSTGTYPPAPGNASAPYFPQQSHGNLGYQTDRDTVYHTEYGTNFDNVSGTDNTTPRKS